MPSFIYTAKTGPSKTVSAQIEAESEQDAISKITKMGYFPISVKLDNTSLDKGVFKKISKKDIVFFTSQLATLVESGVNILNALNLISNQTTNKYLKAVLSDVVSKIKDGKSLSASLSLHPHVFSDLYVSMLHSGEVGGNLEVILKRLSTFLESEEEFKNSLKAALTYPLFIVGVSILTVVVLLTFVIPKLVGMFDDMGQALPLPTKILISVSSGMRQYWWVIIGIIVMFVFLLKRLGRTTQGRFYLDNLALKTVMWGNIVLKTEISHLMRTLSLLFASGVSVISALDISTNILENQVLRLELKRFKDEISGGSSFSKCLNDSKIFPRFVTDIVTVGEETGTLEKGLLRIADEYERDVDKTLKGLVRMAEPIIILVMGLIVGFIVMSMLLPIFQLNLMAK